MAIKESRVMSLDYLFVKKSKILSSIWYKNKERWQVLKFEKPESVSVWHFGLKLMEQLIFMSIRSSLHWTVLCQVSLWWWLIHYLKVGNDLFWSIWAGKEKYLNWSIVHWTQNPIHPAVYYSNDCRKTSVPHFWSKCKDRALNKQSLRRLVEERKDVGWEGGSEKDRGLWHYH